MNRNLLTRVLVFVLITALMLPAFAVAESFKAKVYTDAMKVYSSASTSSTYLGSLKKGIQFKVTSVNSAGTWAKISYNGNEGWAQVKNIISLSHNKKAYTQKTVYVYKNASSSSKKLDKLTADYPVYVVGQSGSYYLVDDANGKFTGYIAKSALGSSKTGKYT